MGEPAWVAALVAPAAFALFFDDTTASPDLAAISAAAARTSFATEPAMAHRWQAAATAVDAIPGTRLQLWASVRVEGTIVPRIRLRWSHGGSQHDEPEFLVERPASGGYVRALLGRITAPADGSRIDFEVFAARERGEGALWWDALWLEPEPDLALPIGTVLVGLPAFLEKRRTHSEAQESEPPLPASAPPLPSRAIFKKPVVALAAAVAIIAAGATAGVTLTGKKSTPQKQSVRSSPSSTPLPGAGSRARFSGTFIVSIAQVTQDNGVYPAPRATGPDIVTQVWAIAPLCDEGVCDLHVSDAAGGGSGGSFVAHPVTPRGRVWLYQITPGPGECSNPINVREVAIDVGSTEGPVTTFKASDLIFTYDKSGSTCTTVPTSTKLMTAVLASPGEVGSISTGGQFPSPPPGAVEPTAPIGEG